MTSGPLSAPCAERGCLHRDLPQPTPLGHVTAATTDGAAENVERLSQKYTGRPYTSYGGPGQTRILLTIAVDTIIHAPVH